MPFGFKIDTHLKLINSIKQVISNIFTQIEMNY